MSEDIYLTSGQLIFVALLRNESSTILMLTPIELPTIVISQGNTNGHELDPNFPQRIGHGINSGYKVAFTIRLYSWNFKKLHYPKSLYFIGSHSPPTYTVLDRTLFGEPLLSGHIREHHFDYYGETAADKTQVPNLWIPKDV